MLKLIQRLRYSSTGRLHSMLFLEGCSRTRKWQPQNIFCQHCCQKHTDILDGQPKVLVEAAGITYNQAYSILKKHKYLQRLDPDRIKKAVEVLEKVGVVKESVKESPECLSILPATIEHHTLCLKECGIPVVKASLLTNYVRVVNRRVGLLKAHRILPTTTNVAENLLNCVEAPDELKRELERAIPNPDEVTILETQRTVVQHFLMWRLEATSEEVDRMFQTYRRLRHKSLTLMKETLSILEDDIGFPKERIKNNSYLLHSHPENTRNSLEKVKYLGGLKTRDVFLAYPKVIMTATDTLVKTSTVLKEFGIPNEAIQKCIHIFTLSSESVRDRLNTIKRTPELNPFLSHPRVLRLIYYYKQANIRLQYLKNMQMKCASLHMLSGPKSVFEKYINEGGDKTRGCDIVHYVSTALRCTRKEVQSKLLKHPYWCHVPLLHMKETLQFLCDSGFSRKQILSSVQLLLYPKLKVEQQLRVMPYREELQPYAKWKDTDYILSLCIYLIEKEHHFSGDGVWTSPDKSVHPFVESDIPLSASNNV